MKPKNNGSDAVREFAARHFVEEARKRGLQRFTVNAGEVHRAMGLHNRVPQVCGALVSGKFLRKNGLRIVEKTGPPSGLSTLVTVTYEFEDRGKGQGIDLDAFYALRGIFRDVYAKYGGGTAYLRAEREGWEDDEHEGGPK